MHIAQMENIWVEMFGITNSPIEPSFSTLSATRVLSLKLFKKLLVKKIYKSRWLKEHMAEGSKEWYDLCVETYKANLPMLKSKYGGKWVAIRGRAILEVGDKPQELSRKYNAPGSFGANVFRVPKEGELERKARLCTPNGLLHRSDRK